MRNCTAASRYFVATVWCDRRDHPVESSILANFKAGDNKILKKLGEETAGEVVMISRCDRGEVADLLYHTLVALAHHRVDLKDVYRKLQERRG